MSHRRRLWRLFIACSVCSLLLLILWLLLFSSRVCCVCVRENTKLFILQYIDAIALLGQLPLPKLNIIQLNRYYSQSIRRMFDDVCAVFVLFFFAPPWNKIFQFNSANEKWIRISTTVKQVTCDVCVMCAFCIKSNKMQPKKTYNKIIGRWIFK